MTVNIRRDTSRSPPIICHHHQSGYTLCHAHISTPDLPPSCHTHIKHPALRSALTPVQFWGGFRLSHCGLWTASEHVTFIVTHPVASSSSQNCKYRHSLHFVWHNAGEMNPQTLLLTTVTGIVVCVQVDIVDTGRLLLNVVYETVPAVCLIYCAACSSWEQGGSSL